MSDIVKEIKDRIIEIREPGVTPYYAKGAFARKHGFKPKEFDRRIQTVANQRKYIEEFYKKIGMEVIVRIKK